MYINLNRGKAGRLLVTFVILTFLLTSIPQAYAQQFSNPPPGGTFPSGPPPGGASGGRPSFNGTPPANSNGLTPTITVPTKIPLPVTGSTEATIGAITAAGTLIIAGIMLVVFSII